MKGIDIGKKLKLTTDDIKKYSNMLIVKYTLVSPSVNENAVDNDVFITDFTWQINPCWVNEDEVRYSIKSITNLKDLFTKKYTGGFWKSQVDTIIDKGAFNKLVHTASYSTPTISLLTDYLNKQIRVASVSTVPNTYYCEVWMRGHLGDWVKVFSESINKDWFLEYRDVLSKRKSLKSSPMKSTKKQQKDGKKMYGQYKGMVGDIKQMGKQFSKNFNKLI